MEPIPAGADLVFRFFPHLTLTQQEQMRMLMPLYAEWNNRINVISRKDLPNLYLHHVLHSLGIAKVVAFKAGTKVLDVGTGGGFPGIPLAILFPDVHFHLADSIGKKITVVKAVAAALKLNNVTAEKIRAEEVQGNFDFAVTRAVATLATVYGWVHRKIKPRGHNQLPNGLLFLKGGDLTAEMQELRRPCVVYHLHDYFPLPFFETKKVIMVEGR
ncbi:MAG: ribosomal RNA small subunit methyltransferase G [Cyclobacteriaceae bacterium]|nr:MAG: ribosomal RNA small subunit methyltransferase G [Cyclobacteriaceae bacterium]